MNLRLMIARMGFVGGMLFGISVNASEISPKLFPYLGLKGGGYSHQVVAESAPIIAEPGVGVPGNTPTLVGYTTPVIPIGAVIGIGYHFKPKFGVRFEAEYLYRITLSSSKPNINAGMGAPSTLETVNILTNASSMLANAYIDYYMLPQVNVYLGAGIGAGMLDTSLKLFGPQNESKIQGNKTNFVWQFGGGVGIGITQHIRLDLSVRFINFDNVAINTSQLDQVSPILPGGLLNFDVTNIEGLVGWSYYF